MEAFYVRITYHVQSVQDYFILLHLPSLVPLKTNPKSKKWIWIMSFHYFSISNHHHFSFSVHTGPTSPAAWIEPPGHSALVSHDVEEMVWNRTEHFTNNDETTGYVED